MKKQAYVIIALTSFLFVFFSPTACWKYLILTGLSFARCRKNRKICLFIVGFQHVHNLSLSPVLARDRRAFSKKNAG